jgi:hypothetical protein
MTDCDLPDEVDEETIVRLIVEFESGIPEEKLRFREGGDWQ